MFSLSSNTLIQLTLFTDELNVDGDRDEDDATSITFHSFRFLFCLLINLTGTMLSRSTSRFTSIRGGKSNSPITNCRDFSLIVLLVIVDDCARERDIRYSIWRRENVVSSMNNEKKSRRNALILRQRIV